MATKQTKQTKNKSKCWTTPLIVWMFCTLRTPTPAQPSLPPLACDVPWASLVSEARSFCYNQKAHTQHLPLHLDHLDPVDRGRCPPHGELWRQCTPWFSLRRSRPASPWSPPRWSPPSSRGTCRRRSGRWDTSSPRRSPRSRWFWRCGSVAAAEWSPRSGSRRIQAKSRSPPSRRQDGRSLCGRSFLQQRLLVPGEPGRERGWRAEGLRAAAAGRDRWKSRGSVCGVVCGVVCVVSWLCRWLLQPTAPSKHS